MWPTISFVKSNAVKILSVIGIGVPGLITLVVNETEEFRITRRLKNGDYGIKAPPDDEFNIEFCAFNEDLHMIKKSFVTSGNFVGLVGLKSTGKSKTLQYLASENNERSIYCEIPIENYTSIADAIYRRMYNDLFKMPFFLSMLRFDRDRTRRKVVLSVLENIAKDGKRVRVFVDIVRSGESSSNVVVENVPNLPSLTKPFRAENFIREAKNLAEDKGLIQLMFASSEGLMFEDEAVREKRLRIFHSNELSLEMSKKYLKAKFNYDCPDDTLLQQIPRTFVRLQGFGGSDNKIEYAERILKRQVKKITKSIMTGEESSQKRLEALLSLALSQSIGFDEIYEFIDQFVKTNIFRPNKRDGTYTFQFDATRLAVKIALGM